MACCLFLGLGAWSVQAQQNASKNTPSIAPKNALIDAVETYFATPDPQNLENIRKVLKAGADVNAKDAKGDPLLYRLSILPKPETLQPTLNVMKMLIQAGADVNAKGTNEWSPLRVLAISPNPSARKIMELLLKAGAEPNDTFEGNQTLLQFLWANPSPDHFKTMKLLIKHGGFDKKLADTLSKDADNDEFEMLMKSTPPSWKNLFLENNCKQDHTITTYIHLHTEDKDVPLRFPKEDGYENIHSQYRKYSSYFYSDKTHSAEKICEKKYAQLKAALAANKKNGTPLKLHYWEKWNSLSDHYYLEEKPKSKTH